MRVIAYPGFVAQARGKSETTGLGGGARSVRFGNRPTRLVGNDSNCHSTEVAHRPLQGRAGESGVISTGSPSPQSYFFAASLRAFR